MRRLKWYVTIVLTMLLASLSACATLKPDPNATEIQQTRKIAVNIFSAVEIAGTGVQGVQQFEIRLHDSGKVSDDTHRNFQTDLLITARVVRTGLTSIQQATRVPELKMTIQAIIDNLKDLKTKYGAQMPDIASMLDITIGGLTIAVTVLGGA